MSAGGMVVRACGGSACWTRYSLECLMAFRIHMIKYEIKVFLIQAVVAPNR